MLHGTHGIYGVSSSRLYEKSHDGASYIFSMTYGMQNYVGREVIKIYSGFCINSAP